uniref:DUF3352 domain-containing protein n=1 Tax=Roseihalotalea indica TaxID=2867963 RepID=A0AA49JIU9_9BACT|nr:DUF3352 domain-containing protein [Tunicatimonas sp. TK19036]
MLRKLSYIIGIALVFGAGVYGYFYYLAQDEPVDIGQLLPEETLWVYHSDQFPIDWAAVRETPLGKVLASLPDLQPVSASLPSLDSIANLTSWLEDRPCYITGQVTGNDDLGFSFYVKLDQAIEENYWQQASANIQQDPKWSVEQRQYQGITIHEWTYKPQNTRFSWVRVDNYLMGSFTPFLVEDQVRRLQQEQNVESSWRGALYQNALSQRDQGDFYINGQQLGALFSIFTAEKQGQKSSVIDALGRTMLLDLTVEEGQWVLSGFSEVGEAQSSSYYLSTFENQAARPFLLSDYLPSRTAAFYQFSFTDVQTWANAYQRFRQQQLTDSIKLQQAYQQFEQKTGKNLIDWLSWAGGEIGVVEMETGPDTPPDKLIIIEIEDESEVEDAMGVFQNAGDSLSFRESFAGYSLYNLNDPALPQFLLGEFGEQTDGPFSECFWFQDSSFLVMSNSVNALKRLISDQRTENTWSKSVRQMRFLERSLDPATFSIVLNLPRYWDRWIGQLSPKWADWARANKASLKQLEKIAVQFSPMDDEYYSSIAVTYQAQPEIAASQGFSTQEQLLLDTTLVSKPYVVRNYTNQQLEVLVQDKAGVVHLVNTSDQSVVWSDSLSATILSDVTQIDFYQNNKLQYLFATDSALHLLDRNGAYVPGYPLHFTNNEHLKYLSVFDYDQNRNYRFLVTDQQGNLWLYSQDRENLPGWNPLSLTEPLAQPPQHVRVRGKDCIIALQQNGILHVFNRRGEDYPGFPMNWEQACHNPVFVEVGNTFQETVLTTISDNGELISVNLEGTLLKREQQFRASSSTQFMLSPDRLGKTFILARQDNQRLSILDASGRTLFEQSYFTPGAMSRNELAVQYYDFGAGNQIIAITDKIQEFTYLFDETGKLQNDRPIESTNEIGLIYSDANNQYRIYRVYENEVSIVSF